MLRTKIVSTGSYLPDRILTNPELENMVDTSDQWITERTGIKERRIADVDQAVSDLALKAAEAALTKAGLSPKEIDLIIIATITGDMPVPSSACILQDKLGALNAAAFDINAACSGFIYGLSIADAYIKSSVYKRILLIGAEVLSKFTNWKDRNTCVLFGDGAGAVILEPSDNEQGIYSVDIYSDGTMASLLNLPGGGSKYPPSHQSLQNNLHYLQMKGNETFKVAVKTLESLVISTIEKNNIKSQDIKLLIPHQANLRIISATASRLGISMDRVMVNLNKCGNTSAASIPIALDEAATSGTFERGDYILLEAFGGGLTWASALIKW